jgi:hypothetical protein
MIRTRDFLLFMMASGFLVVAIFSTAVWNHRVHSGVQNSTIAFATKNSTYTAEAVMAPDTKNERLAALRKKLAEQTTIDAPEQTVDDATSTPVASTTEPVISAPAESKVVVCGKSYSPKTIAGLTGMQQYEERDGQRIFFETTLPLDPGTSTPALPPAEKIIFTLPLRTAPLPVTSCIKDDVVAVSQTGVLIRNDDYVKYQESGESTLIGYTIDGFPLYGRTNSITTDSCGGAMIDGAYRYYLSAERKGVLGCFAGIPVAL